MFCSSCGNAVPMPTGRFCHVCGASLAVPVGVFSPAPSRTPAQQADYIVKTGIGVGRYILLRVILFRVFLFVLAIVILGIVGLLIRSTNSSNERTEPVTALAPVQPGTQVPAVPDKVSPPSPADTNDAVSATDATPKDSADQIASPGTGMPSPPDIPPASRSLGDPLAKLTNGSSSHGVGGGVGNGIGGGFAPAIGGVFKVGGGVSAPAVLFRVDPGYSEEARTAKLSGTVLLSIVVDTEGHARDIHVVKSLGMGLDEKAMDAVAMWKFKPGMKDGQPVNVRAQIEVNFRML